MFGGLWDAAANALESVLEDEDDPRQQASTSSKVERSSDEIGHYKEQIKMLRDKVRLLDKQNQELVGKEKNGASTNVDETKAMLKRESEIRIKSGERVGERKGRVESTRRSNQDFDTKTSRGNGEEKRYG